MWVAELVDNLRAATWVNHTRIYLTGSFFTHAKKTLRSDALQYAATHTLLSSHRIVIGVDVKALFLINYAPVNACSAG